MHTLITAVATAVHSIKNILYKTQVKKYNTNTKVPSDFVFPVPPKTKPENVSLGNY
jgi:hypothetical protein